MHEAKVTGRICHIKAAEPGGPRYDPFQTDEARHAFENLILMCPIHHDVIDADPTAYTAEKLATMKADHEGGQTAQFEVSERVVNQLLIDLSGVSVAHGSIIFTQNQIGGQVAHTINNFGPPRRAVTPQMRGHIIDVLKGARPSRIAFASTQGDMEAHEFKQQLIDVFRSAGWHAEDLQTFMFFAERKGIVVTIPFGANEEGLPQIVYRALSETGNPISGNRGDMAKNCGIYVQIWHAP